MANFDDISFTKMTFTEGSVPTTPAANNWTVYTKTDGLYVVDDAGTETGPFGAGGSGSVPDWIARLAAPSSPYADDQEFTGSIGGTAVTPTGTATWAQADGVLGCTFSGQSANDICPRLYTLTPSSAPATAHVSVPTFMTRGTANPMVGVCFADGTTASSNAVAVAVYASSAQHFIATLTGTITNMSVTNVISNWTYSQPNMMRLKLVWTAANTWAWAISGPAGPFTDFSSSTFASTMTPTHFGPWVSSWSQSFASVAAFDYARITAADESV